DDIIVGAALNGHVKVFSGADNSVLQSFFAFPDFAGEFSLAAGFVDGDAFADIIVGAGPGPTSGHVKVFSGTSLGLIQSFFAFPGFNGGVQVAANDRNSDGRADVIVGAGPGAVGGHIKVFDGVSQALLDSYLAFPGFSGGVFVG